MLLRWYFGIVVTAVILYYLIVGLTLLFGHRIFHGLGNKLGVFLSTSMYVVGYLYAVIDTRIFITWCIAGALLLWSFAESGVKVTKVVIMLLATAQVIASILLLYRQKISNEFCLIAVAFAFYAVYKLDVLIKKKGG